MSRSSSPERVVFVAHQLCPPHLRQLIKNTVESFDNVWLLSPVEGEFFDLRKAYLARLQGFALSRGFARWLKPKKTHDKASKRSMTGAEAAEQAADKAEKVITRPKAPRQVESDGDDEDDGVVVPGTPPRLAGESQGGTSITLPLRTPERLRGPPELIHTLISEPAGSPEALGQLPASTAPARIEEGARKRRRTANKFYGKPV